VRRAVPWLLVFLVAAGGGLGVGIGLANQSLSAHAQILQILRRTETSGTARFTTLAVNTEPGTRLRMRIAGSGEINFKTGSLTVTLDYSSAGPHATLLISRSKMIEIGRVRYSYLPTPSVPRSIGSSISGPVAYSWQKESLLSASDQGSGSLNGLTNLLQLPRSIQTMRDLGLGIAGGREATEYQIGPSQCHSSASGITQTYSTAASNLWVDGRGRLIRDEIVQTIVFHPKGISTGATKLAETASIRFYDFGAPVDITAPAHATEAPGVSSVSSPCS
jgi:hypothetical protein